MRYERERPGELVHVDVKKIARMPNGGGRGALGRGCGPGRGAGPSCPRAAVDNVPGCRSAEFNGMLGGEGRKAQVHEALQPLAERQGREDEPHAGAGAAVREALDAFIEHYNYERPHSACGGPPPIHASSV